MEKGLKERRLTKCLKCGIEVMTRTEKGKIVYTQCHGGMLI